MTRIFLRRFLCHEEANVLMLTGLGILILFAIGGAAVDFGRQQLVRGRLQQATDAAALGAAALPDGATNADRQNAALRFYQMNYPAEYLGVSRPSPTISVGSTISVSANGEVQTNFISNVGVNTLQSGGRTVVATNTISTGSGYDMVMAFDISGSMTANEDVGSSGIRVVPSGLVNTARTNGRNACNQYKTYVAPVFNSYNCNAVPDTGPAGTETFGMTRAKRLNALRGSAYGLADDLLNDSPTSRIAVVQWSSRVMKTFDFTSDKSAVLNEIDTMAAFGGTNSANAMNHIKNNMAANYRDDAIPVVVLLTDGVNFDPYYRNPKGSQSYNAEINADTLSACTALKSRTKPVQVYTVAFGDDVTTNPAANNMLRDCASRPEFYFQADNSAELMAAFNEIFETVRKLRITE